MSRGSIRRRGRQSWELKFDTPADDGQRRTRYVTVRGKRQDAQRELTRLLGTVDGGTFVDPSTITVAEHVRVWIAAADVSPKTRERYGELADGQIVPHIGAHLLQRLRPAHIEAWHAALLAAGGKGGRPLSARTVGHCHRLLRTALQAAVRVETLARNVASVVSPPRVEEEEMQILDNPADVLARLAGHPLHIIAATALGTGMRRGELLALAWPCVDLDGARATVERSLEETDGLRFKPPKSKAGRRTIALPAGVVALLREHRKAQLELRMQLGIGKPPDDALVFCELDGSPIAPDKLSRRWGETCRSRDPPDVTFHALRHTHASALIAAGVDVVQVSKRLGHANPAVTLRVYSHLFRSDDAAAAAAMDAVMR